jgi:hypothetical protein
LSGLINKYHSLICIFSTVLLLQSRRPKSSGAVWAPAECDQRCAVGEGNAGESRSDLVSFVVATFVARELTSCSQPRTRHRNWV